MDTRKSKTREKIKQAFIVLMKEKDPASISVSSICETADINRSTFYEHYPYVAPLIEDVIKDQLSSISVLNDELLDQYHINNYTTPKEAERYVRNFVSNEVLLRLSKSKEAYHFKVLIANLSIRNELEKYSIKDPVERADIIYRNYGVFAIIFGWLEKSINMSIEDVSSLLYRHIRKDE